MTDITDDELLNQLLAEQGFSSTADAAINKLSSRQNVPLSFAQQRLWILDQMEPNSLNYLLPRVFKLQGPIDLELLNQTFNYLVARHEIFRTGFRLNSATGEPVQYISEHINFAISQHDLTSSQQQAQAIQNKLSLDKRSLDKHSLDKQSLDKQSKEEKIAVEEKIKTLAARPFNLRQAPLMRADLIKVEAQRHYLLLCLHHIVTDAVSNGVFLKEFIQIYLSLSQGQSPSLPALPIQYADYAAWQRQYFQAQVLDQQLDYWRQQLGTDHPILNLPLDRPRPVAPSYQGAVVEFELNPSLSQQINHLAASKGITPFVVLLAAYHLLLARYSQQADIRVGVPVANRRRQETEGLIGFFVNTQVIRVLFDENLTVDQLFDRVQQLTTEAHNAQDLPFEYLVDALNPERDANVSPLFQALFNFLQNPQTEALENNMEAGIQLANLHISQDLLGLRPQAKFDLSLVITSTGNKSEAGYQATMEYFTELFDHSTVQGFADSYLCLLEAMVEAMAENRIEATSSSSSNYNNNYSSNYKSNYSNRVATLPMMSSAVYQQVMADWNQTAADFPRTQVINQLIETQVAKTPDAEAVIFEGESLSYKQLNAKANQLAHYLIEVRGVRPDTRVGLMLERSLELVISLLAIIKAGGAYVPLDPDYPPARLQYISDDAGVVAVITRSELSQRLPQFSDDQIVPYSEASQPQNSLKQQDLDCLDSPELQARLANFSDQDIGVDEIGLTPQHLAYVMYTSGSTGKPKGVMIEHLAVVNRIHWMHQTYGATPADRFLQKTPFSFDLSVWEFIWPLMIGAPLVVAKPGGHGDPEYLTGLIQQQKISKIHFVPSMLATLLAAADLSPCRSLKQVFSGGEALPLSYVEALYKVCPWLEYHNLYGPTEATLDVSHWSCEPVKLAQQEKSRGLKATPISRIPIGKPIQNTQLYVFDSELNPVPPGVVGELHIGGLGLARGYLNRPELTEEKFIANPYFEAFQQAGNTNTSSRLYKTGDLVRWLPDGNIEYLNRIDFQIKLRGQRIELAEIEHSLNRQPMIHESCVQVHTSAAGDQRLVAFLVLATQNSNEKSLNEKNLISEPQMLATADSEQLREKLGLYLPQYMVPSHFVALEALPLTANGKTDRKALPTDLPGLQVNPEQDAEYQPPETPEQQRIAELWRQTLALPASKLLGLQDNFFDCGGDSLSAIRLMTSIRRSFAIELPLTSIFQAQTIADLAKLVTHQEPQSYSTLVKFAFVETHTVQQQSGHSQHPQTGHPQTGHPQTGHPQTGHPQTGHPQTGQPQTGHPQTTEQTAQTGHPQTAQTGHTQQPQTGQPQTGQPQTGQPQTGHPQTEHPQTGHPQTGQPQTGQPQTGQPQTGHPQTRQPQTGQPQTGPQTGQPQTGQPQTGQPQTGQPQTGQPQTGQPQTGHAQQTTQTGQPQTGHTQTAKTSSMTPLFCFHPAGGHVTCYRPMAEALKNRQAMIGVQARDMIHSQVVPQSMAQLVADYGEQIIRQQTQGPYRLFGWCLGARIAIAVADYLEKQGKAVTWVGAVDYDPAAHESLSHDSLSQESISDKTIATNKSVSPVDELFKDFLDYLREEGIDLSANQIDQIQQTIAPLSYQDGLEKLIEYGLQQEYLGSAYSHEQLKLSFMAHKKASDLVKDSPMAHTKAKLGVWLTEQKQQQRPAIVTDWQSYSSASTRVSVVPEVDHFTILQSPQLHREVLADLNE